MAARAPKALPPARYSALDPGGAVAPPPLTPDESRANDAAIDTFVLALGGRDALLDVLAVAADQPEADRIVSLLLDPRYDGFSLKRLCRLANLTIADLFATYKSAMIVRAHLAAYRTITEKLLPVVDDVMTRAAPYKVGCAACGTDGKARDEKGQVLETTCPQCAGAGHVYQLPDLDRQKLALELAQLVQKSLGVNVLQQNLTVAAGDRSASGSASLIALQQAVRHILSGPRTPIAAEPPDPPPSTLDAEVVDSPL